jgi:predicted O-linked N-acetylglucosamine transferase (SPINDLY family)
VVAVDESDYVQKAVRIGTSAEVKKEARCAR